MNANNNKEASMGAEPKLNNVTGGRRLTMSLAPDGKSVEVYLGDEAVGEMPVQPIVDAYGKAAPIVNLLRRQQPVRVLSPHLAAWLLGKSTTVRPAYVEDVVRLNAMLSRKA